MAVKQGARPMDTKGGRLSKSLGSDIAKIMN